MHGMNKICSIRARIETLFLFTVAACWLDPVCRLNLGNSGYNQLFRLCVIVLTSSYFKGRVGYPYRVDLQQPSHFVEGVSFQTEEGKNKSGDRQYHELVVQCWASKIDTENDVEIYYISTAYTEHQVFVYVNQQDVPRKFVLLR